MSDGELSAAVQRLLDELCVDLGFCLPPADQARLREVPPLDPDAFTEAVFVAEGMDPSLHEHLRRRVWAKVATRMPAILGAFQDERRS